MAEPELPATLIDFLNETVLTYPAAVLLVFLSRTPGQSWTAESVADAMKPDLMSPTAVQEFAGHFARAGLLRFQADGSFVYDPPSEAARTAVIELARAYDERPVTLVRTIYSIANVKLRSFADAFRLKRDE